MSANLNLASQPFRNRALPWTIAGVIAIASLVTLVFLISSSNETNRRANAVEREIDSQRQQISALEKRAEELRQALTPDQLQTLKEAHALVQRKRFSWARLFADLEAALPGSVRVKRISVGDVSVRGGRTLAQLELAVVSKNPADVTAMISKMDQEGIFQAQLVEQNLSKERSANETESTLDVFYRPRGVMSVSESAGSVATVNAVQATEPGPR